jgi:glycosyltransferase involved in cell wall biosynthesis
VNKVLFIGSFLSRSFGSKDVAEKISNLLTIDGYDFILCSRRKNKVSRLLSILFTILLFKGRIIHFDVFSGQAFRITQFGGFLARIRKKRILYTLHGGALIEFAEKHPRLIKQVFGKADYIQTPSLFLKEYFEHEGYKVSYLPNPIDLAKFPFHRDLVKPYKLLWVRAFAYNYNPWLAIETIKLVREVYHDSTLTMIGPDKGELNKTLNLIEAYGLEDEVNILGPVSNEMLHKYYNTHDVYINTTSYESFGVSVLEAAACGIPIVSTNVGELPYIWNQNENALLIDSMDAQSMAECVINILSSPDLAKGLSESARIRAEEFSWDQIKPKWLQLLNV